MSAAVDASDVVAKDSAAAALLDEWRRSGQAVVLRINDRFRYKIKDEGSLQKLMELLDRLDAIAAIQAGLDDVAAGRTMSLDEFKQARDHGISNACDRHSAPSCLS